VSERIVVTGAQGFLGRWVTACLLAADEDLTVIGVGRSSRSGHHYPTTVSRGLEQVPAPLPAELAGLDGHPRYEYRQADVTSLESLKAVLGTIRPGVVVHSAAALRDESWSALVATNVAATATVVQALAEASPHGRLVLVSSGSVYGAADRLPLRESDCCRPVDPYAVTKYSAENVARVAAARAGIGLWTARVFNLLGPGLQERHLPAALAAQLSAIAAGFLPPRLRRGALRTSREYIDVRDAAAAVAVLARTPIRPAAPTLEGMRDTPDLVNVSWGREIPVQHILEGLLAATAARRTLPELEWEPLPARPADLPRVMADTGRLAGFGFQACYEPETTLGDMIDYYLNLVLV
jgi:nucleoside-diphosphate-sugar epimerase